MSFINWILGGIKDFIGGMLSEFFNWLVDVVVEIADRLGTLLEKILNIFQFVPHTAKYFDRLLRAVLFFCPDIVFKILYSSLAIIGIIIVVKFVLRMFGKG